MTGAKVCNKCGTAKPLDRFSPAKGMAAGRHGTCRACRAEIARQRRADNPAEREYQREYRRNHPEAQREAERRWRAAHPDRLFRIRERAMRGWRRGNRQAVLDHYGRSCACCGSTERLCIDHVNGDGKAHRAKIGVRTGTAMYRWLVKNNFPSDPPLQVLCLPCNVSKRDGEHCRLDHQAAEAA